MSFSGELRTVRLGPGALARRLVEKGVRFVKVGSGDWDDHKDIEKAYGKKAPAMDRAAAALIQDLKQRGMLRRVSG